MATLSNIITSLLRFEVGQVPLPDHMNRSFSESQRAKLFSFSHKYDIAHLVGDALMRSDLIARDDKEFTNAVNVAQYRAVSMEVALEEITAVLEAQQIPYIPMKGSVLRKYYPAPWMRIGCDVDVLIHKEDLERAKRALCRDAAFTFDGTAQRDISLHSQTGVSLELHFDFGEKSVSEETAVVFSRVWELARPVSDKGYEYEMLPEMFYFHQIAHIAKHLRVGGCGMRPFLDLWVMNRSGKWDVEQCNHLLREGGLLPLAEAVRQLSSVWFEEAEHTEVTRRLEAYVLSGGLYAGLKNRMALKRETYGGQKRYLRSRIVLPYKDLKEQYPTLHSKWLAPAYQLWRWCTIVCSGRGKNLSREIKMNAKMSLEEQREIVGLFEDLGLKR